MWSLRPWLRSMRVEINHFNYEKLPKAKIMCSDKFGLSAHLLMTTFGDRNHIYDWILAHVIQIAPICTAKYSHPML